MKLKSISKELTLSSILLVVLMTISAAPGHAATMRYVFEGVITGFESFHSEIDIDDYSFELGVTPLRYVFDVDFDRDVSDSTNSTGTWNYFYSDLVEGSMVNGGFGGGSYNGFNWTRNDGAHMGQITSVASDVRVSAKLENTPNWRVQDWTVGESFESADLACYPGSSTAGCAVYAYGSVTLQSITAVPLPPAVLLLATALFGGAVVRRFRAQT